MNRRTRLLAYAALGLAGLLLAGLLIRGVMLRPLRTLDDQLIQLQAKLNSLQNERKAFVAADAQVRAAAAHMFGASADAAEAKLGAMLTAQIVRVGLREADFTRLPAPRRRLPGADEVGWTIQGEGRLAAVLDLLFLLHSEPRLHRVESLALSPADQEGRVRVRFRYLTLVLNPAPEVAPAEPLSEASLSSAARRRYDAIARRDLLRPYVPAESAPTPAPSPTAPAAVSAPSPANTGQNLKVVSLSTWLGQPEVHLYDTQNQRTFRCRPGEKLLEGELVMVDYRALPVPGKPGLVSYSRLIGRTGNDYWTVEAGQTLAERRRLSPEDLPAPLELNSTNTLSP